jgi:hypothetical protein
MPFDAATYVEPLPVPISGSKVAAAYDSGKHPYTNSSVSSIEVISPAELKNDKLTLMSRYPIEQHHQIEDMICAEFGGDSAWDHLNAYKKNGFSLSFTTRLPDMDGNPSDNKAVIMLGTLPASAPGGPYTRLRVEYNPALAGSHGDKHLRSRLGKALPGGAKQFIEKAYVTRIDHAVDIPGVRVDDIIVDVARRQCATVYTDRHGNANGVYFGRRDAKRFLRAYQKGPSKKEPGTVARLKYQIRDAGKLSDIHSMKNPFAGVTVYHFVQENLASFNRFFIDSARQRGLKRALKIATEAERAVIDILLAASEAVWWKPELFWKSWQ